MSHRLPSEGASRGSPLAYASIVVSSLALCLAAFAAWQSAKLSTATADGPAMVASASSVPRPGGGQPAIVSLQQADLAISRDIKALSDRVAALEGRDGGARPESSAALAAEEPRARMPDGTPAYARFEPPKGVEIKQLESGALAVTNTDPSLAGKTLHIPAFAPDGSKDEVTIIVPPPAR